ncbi:MAG: DsbA family protein [Bacteroidia bacterium]|nr:DsbA family protein [Bacteroidia bacterium]
MMAKVYYVFDPLCGWCYGFSPIITSVFHAYKDRLEFEVLSGGMVTGERAGPMEPETANYIRQALGRVTEVTGTEFGDAFVNNILGSPEVIQDSLPPASLLTAFQEVQAENAIPFASALQKKIYFDGVEPTDMESLAEIYNEMGLNAEEMLALARTEKIKKATEAQFAQSSAWGVRGFPTVIGEKNDNLYLLTNGACSREELESKLNALLQL